MPLKTIHNTFTKGELDPTLLARVDIDIYTKGARKLRNMVALWTGAAAIAPGTTYTDMMIDRENGNAVITNADYINIVDFLFDAAGEVTYTVVLRASNAVSAIDIYYNDTFQVTVGVAPYTLAQIKDVHFAVGHDRILLLHESVPIGQLVRGATSLLWTLSVITPNVNPTFDFTVIGGTQYRTPTFTFTLGALTGLGIALTASAAIFTSGHVGGLYRAGAGSARITAVNAAGTIATVNILDDFLKVLHGGDVSSLKERMWHDATVIGAAPAAIDRGFPSRGVFYLNRLILGHSSSLKNICAVSTAGVYDDFDDSDVDAAASFSVSFNGKGEQSVESIVADDSIVFLTTNKVFAQSPLVETPLSASSFYFAPQSQNPGSDVEAVTIDNQILYASGNKTQVTQLVYNTGDAKYIGYPAGLLSNHLFQTVNSNATWDPGNVQARLYLATQLDGSLLMYSTLLQQNVSAWSKRTTRGKFKQVIGDGRQAHVLVERQINLGITTFQTTMDYAYTSNSLMTAFNNVTTAFSDGVTTLTSVFEDDNNQIVLGNDIPFTAIDLTLSTLSSHDCALTFEYLDLNGFWDVFTPTDNTTGFTASGSVTWTFDNVLNWQPNNVNGIEQKYWIRIKRTADTVTTTPIVQQLDVNTGVRLYLERMEFGKYMDSTVTTSSSATGAVTGLTTLAGQQVYAIADGATTGPFFVDSAGATNIKSEFAAVDIGIQYKPELVPMPLLTPGQDGDNTYSNKYIQDMFVDYVDSLYLQAGSLPKVTDIPNMQLGNYTLGQSVSPQTGVYAMHPRGNWNPRQELYITQSQPGPMTIIGIGYHVEVT